MSQRALELILTANGRAELVDIDTGKTVWAADADDDFNEEFSEFLTEADIEHVLDYLVANEIITEDEADNAELSMEAIDDGTQEVNGEFLPANEDDVDEKDEDLEE